MNVTIPVVFDANISEILKPKTSIFRNTDTLLKYNYTGIKYINTSDAHNITSAHTNNIILELQYTKLKNIRTLWGSAEPVNYDFLAQTSLIGIVSAKFIVDYYESKTHYYIDDIPNNPIFYKTYTGNGMFSGATYLIERGNILESEVTLLHNSKPLKTTTTINGKYSFNFLNTELKYNMRARPLSLEYNAQTIFDIYPVVDNASFKFHLYCFYDRIYIKNTLYTIQVRTVDTRGELVFNLSSAPSGVTIGAATGLLTVNINTIGKYNFTVTCTDYALSATKSMDFNIEIVDTFTV